MLSSPERLTVSISPYLYKVTGFLESKVSTMQLKIVVEKHPEGYVAYPLGMKGIVVGEGETYEEALADVKSAIKFHIETFGEDVFEPKEVMETFVAEVVI